MAIEIEQLITRLEVNQRQFEKKLAAANQNSKRQTRSIQRNFDKMNRSVSQGVARHFGSAAKSISVIHGPLGGVASRFSAIGSILGSVNPLLAGTSLAMAGVGFAAYKALVAFQAFETQQLVTEQVIRATGGAAGKTAEDIEQLALSVGFSTLASVEGARKAATQLLTFRSISGETFERTLRLAQDLATVGFGTLESSAVQLGKALEDPKTGLTALRRVGVSFSESQKQVIQDLFDTGRVAQAQEKILDGLEKQVGGAGKASGQGLAGAYDTLSEATQILLERWGSQIAEAVNLRAAILGIAGAIDDVNLAASKPARVAQIGHQLLEIESRLLELKGHTDSRPQFTGPLIMRLEKERAALKKQELALVNEIDTAAVKSEQARLDGIEAQKQMELERAEGVLSNLGKELELARKTNIEREISTRLAKAGVAAESELGMEIEQAVRRIAAAEKDRADAKKSHSKGLKAAKAAERETLAVLKLIDAMEFERTLITMTGKEQAVANALRQAGAAATEEQRQKIIALAEARHEEYQAAEASNENLRKLKQLGRDTFSGLVDDLRRGTDATDALANALDRLADRLLDSAFDSLFASGSGGAGIFDFLGNIFGGGLGAGSGGGFGSQASIAAGGVHTQNGPRNLPRFSRGGISSRAAIFGEAGPEAAVPLPDGRRIPVDLDLTGRGRAGQGREVVEVRLIDDSGRMADIADRRIETATGDIVRISVEHSRQAGRADFAGNAQEYDLRRKDRAPWL